jgi:hypothetical protein
MIKHVVLMPSILGVDVLSRANLPAIVFSYLSVSATVADRSLLSAQIAAITMQTFKATFNRSWETIKALEYNFFNISGGNLPMSNFIKQRSTHAVLATAKTRI